jgi:hypothetical protein
MGISLIVVSVIWYLVGVASFIYWWIEDFDLDIGSLVVGLFAGILGPISFMIGYLGSDQSSIVLIKRRTK